MKKIKNDKRLRLHTETVRQISALDLANVAGGAPPASGLGCGPTYTCRCDSKMC